MVDFTSIAGITPPTSTASFLALLQNASFNGVPFKVTETVSRKGRRIALHEYPYVDGAKPEDMGRAARVYAFTGYLIGDAAAALQLALDAAVESQGPGLLIHPVIGAVRAALTSCSSSVSKDRSRVIALQMEFVEDTPQSLTTQLIATAIQVVTASASAIAAIGTSLGNSGGAAAAAGAPATAEGVAVVGAFAAACTTVATDPAGLVAIAVGLPPPDGNTSYGRYANGGATVALPPGTTVPGLQAQLAAQRTAVSAAGTAASAAAATLSVTSGGAVTAALTTLTEAARVTMTDPADQLRTLTSLAGFAYADAAGGGGLGSDLAQVRDSMAAACRRAALLSLANAAAAYQPSSYQDAVAVREQVAEALGQEITAAGDAGEDDAYLALRALRAAVIQDLTTRGATLPQVVSATFRVSLPSLVVAQILYRDGSRSDQIITEAGPIHPAFCPTAMQVLAA